jgi:hypothetical protein
MKAVAKILPLVAVLLFSFGSSASAQGKPSQKNAPVMKTWLIERDIPGAGAFTPADLKGISQKSCSVLKEMGTGIQWVQSYVTGNKVFCVYRAENEALLREHAKKGGFPVTSITEIANTISPATAEN